MTYCFGVSFVSCRHLSLFVRLIDILYRIGIRLKRYPRKNLKISADRQRFRALTVPVRSASLMCIEKMIDEMSDACYLEHYCFRHRLHSCSLAARFLRIATCHTSSLFCVTACHMTSCIIKTAAPNEKIGTAVLLCKASQIFFHVLILNIVYLLAFPRDRGQTSR